MHINNQGNYKLHLEFLREEGRWGGKVKGWVWGWTAEVRCLGSGQWLTRAFFSSQDWVLCGGQAESLPSFERCGHLFGLCHLFDTFREVFVFSMAFSAIYCGKNCHFKSAIFSRGGILWCSQHMMGPGAKNVRSNTWLEGGQKVLQRQGICQLISKALFNSTQEDWEDTPA